jgi:hypothetical protein
LEAVRPEAESIHSPSIKLRYVVISLAEVQVLEG